MHILIVVQLMYTKFVKRGDKNCGPYAYHSVRVNGKVVSKYLGKFNPDKHSISVGRTDLDGKRINWDNEDKLDNGRYVRDEEGRVGYIPSKTSGRWVGDDKGNSWWEPAKRRKHSTKPVRNHKRTKRG
jgi:hypothetical protein